MKCPHCLSENVQVHYNLTKQGFSEGKGCLGMLLLGIPGLLFGFSGKNKIKSEEKYWLCNNCGSKFSDTQAQEFEKAMRLTEIISSNEENLIGNPNYESILSNREYTKNTFLSHLDNDNLKRFVFTNSQIAEETAKDILSSYIKPDFNIDLSNDCIYFMYNETTVLNMYSGFTGNIFTSSGIYCHWPFSEPLFIPKNTIKSISVSKKDILIDTTKEKIFLNFARLNLPEVFDLICQVLNKLYLT